MDIDIVFKILGWFVPAILTFFIGRITAAHTKLKRDKDERESLFASSREALKICLRRFLKDDYDFYALAGFCSIEDKSEVEAAYKIYHALGGNGQGTRYYEAIMSLPDVKQ